MRKFASFPPKVSSLKLGTTNLNTRRCTSNKSPVSLLVGLFLIGVTLLSGCSGTDNSQAKPKVGDVVHKGDDWHFTYMASADGVNTYDDYGNKLATPDTSGANCDYFENDITYTLEDGAKNTIAVAELDSTPQFVDVTLLCVAYYTIKNMPELTSPVKLFRTHGNGQLAGSVDYWGWYAPDQITQGQIFQREQIDSYPPANPALELTEDSEP